MVELTLERRIPALSFGMVPPIERLAGSATLATLGTAVWQAVRSVLGLDPPGRYRQLAADAILVRILLDRGQITPSQAASAAIERDRSGLLLEHVLHALHGVPMSEILSALAERRAVIGKPLSRSGPRKRRSDRQPRVPFLPRTH